MVDRRFYVLFDSTTVITGRLADESEGLCAWNPVRMKRSTPQAGPNPGLLDRQVST